MATWGGTTVGVTFHNYFSYAVVVMMVLGEKLMQLVEHATFATLMLKPLQQQQAEAFLAHINDNRDIYEEVIPFVSHTHNLAQMQTVISANLTRQSQGEALFYTLWDSEVMAGYLLVREINRDANWAEIGYMLGKQWQRQGITTMACRWLIERLFALDSTKSLCVAMTTIRAA
ncbi:MAG: GNAT family N-acetyltransferase [Shewanella fodinae]|nr:GNAT family N-acetyltransferase [Shewanella fodinae]